MMYQIKMTYTAHDYTMRGRDESGRMIVSRVIGHPKRPAKAYESDTWWEDIEAYEAAMASEAGCVVRLR